MGNKAVFFDRDGVLNVDVHYLHKKEDFVWVDGAPEAVKYCNDHGYRVIVITNQSGVARGYYTEQDIAALHDWMNEQLQQWGAHIDAFYYCPHHPQGTVLEYTRSCNCRKPETGMIDLACRQESIDRRQAVFFGDAATDMECARRANIKGYHFQSGNLLQFVQSQLKKSGIAGKLKE